jgi:hypothetical protein
MITQQFFLSWKGIKSSTLSQCECHLVLVHYVAEQAWPLRSGILLLAGLLCRDVVPRISLVQSTAYLHCNQLLGFHARDYSLLCVECMLNCKCVVQLMGLPTEAKQHASKPWIKWWLICYCTHVKQRYNWFSVLINKSKIENRLSSSNTLLDNIVIWTSDLQNCKWAHYQLSQAASLRDK